MIVVNLCGGAGCGKSTTAAGVFHALKVKHINAELVTEFAKELLYDKRLENMLDQQEFIFAEQNYRLHRLRNVVDYAITDSPLLLSSVYVSKDFAIRDMFREYVRQTHHLYENINIYLERPEVNFSESGRRHTLLEARAVDKQILEELERWGINYHVVKVGQNTVDDIVNIIERK